VRCSASPSLMACNGNRLNGKTSFQISLFRYRPSPAREHQSALPPCRAVSGRLPTGGCRPAVSNCPTGAGIARDQQPGIVGGSARPAITGQNPSEGSPQRVSADGCAMVLPQGSKTPIRLFGHDRVKLSPECRPELDTPCGSRDIYVAPEKSVGERAKIHPGEPLWSPNVRWGANGETGAV
jgi:hypothetical protein